MRALLAVSILLVTTSLSSAFAQNATIAGRYADAGIDDSTRAIQFFERFRGAVEAARKKEVLSMLAFPIGAWIAGVYVTFETPAALLKEYDRVFNARVKRALLAQDPHTLFVSSQGIMVGRGEVWFGPHRKAIKVFTINNEFPAE
jgi:hypothetical protein